MALVFSKEFLDVTASLGCIKEKLIIIQTLRTF